MTDDNDTFTYQVANAQDAATDTWSDTYTAAWQDGYRAARNGTAPRPDTTTDGAEQAGYRQGIADALDAIRHHHPRPVVDIDHNQSTNTTDDTTKRASINC